MGANLNRNFYSTSSVSDKFSLTEEIEDEDKEKEETSKRTGFIAKKFLLQKKINLKNQTTFFCTKQIVKMKKKKR